MFRYLLKRILIFIPTLLVISLIAFGISKLTPGDPVTSCGNLGGQDKTYLNDYFAAELAYNQRAQSLGLDKPSFYFSFTSRAYPDTLYKVLNHPKRAAIAKLISRYGNWPQIDHYFKAIDALEIASYQIPQSEVKNAKIEIRKALSQLKINYNDKRVNYEMKALQKVFEKDSLVQKYVGQESKALFLAYDQMRNQSSTSKLFQPKFHWYGFDNQYHIWFTKFITGDFGYSCQDGRPVKERIKRAIGWTLIMNIFALILAFSIAIPLGVFSAQKRGSRFDKWTGLILFVLYSLPGFWVATLLVIFFTTPEYGMHWFPSIGLGDTSTDIPFWSRFWDRASHLFLPIICLSYGSLAFIARQMRGGVLNVIQQDYIRTARAKGQSEEIVLWKHAFRNSLFPIITLIALVFPATISGSVVIEYIFNIPGMGRETIAAIYAKDWPIVFTILLLTTGLTMIGTLIADILYAWADPRVNFKK